MKSWIPEVKTASQAWQTSPRAFQYLAAVSTGMVALSMVLTILYLKDRLAGFDELDWLGNERWRLFGLFAWSLLTTGLIGLTKLAWKERKHLADIAEAEAYEAAKRRLAEHNRKESNV